MNVHVVIPARYGSTRFPGKPLANQTGKFLIQHVYEQAARAEMVARVIVATDDGRIADAVRSFGGEAVMTRPEHESGTDRIAEIARRENWLPDDLILNVQGDEPEIEPDYLNRLARRMKADVLAPMGTLATPFAADSDPRDPNCVKVVLNRRSRALYFSRALIPYPRDDRGAIDPSGWLLHIGVYAYRRSFLLEFAEWEPSELERIEKLEQLRALDRNCPIAVERVERATIGIDTPEDYAQFVARWRKSNG